jgi:hypothetical protein
VPTLSINANGQRRAFTLVEALMAAGILLMIVFAVTSAITAGQQHAFEAHKRIAGTLAAEELMGRLITEPYADLASWNGYTEAVGAMTDMYGQPMPQSFDAVGRDVTVVLSLEELPDVGVNIRGRTVTVRSFDTEAQTLAELTRFIPEPQS